jgi:superfamily II DNA helicase RecQ
MHDALDQSPQVVVANNCAIVGIFDQLPKSAQFILEAAIRDKQPFVVVDEAHQLTQEKWRTALNRACEFGSQLKQRSLECPWLLLSGTLPPNEEQPLVETLALPKIHTVLRGSARTENLILEVIISAFLIDIYVHIKNNTKNTGCNGRLFCSRHRQG